jgi:hypothetical protein
MAIAEPYRRRTLMRRLIACRTHLIAGGTLAAAAILLTPAAALSGAVPTAGGYRTEAVTIPAGTLLRLRLSHSVGSDVSRIEEPVTATLAVPVRYHGREVLPAGSTAHGYITTAQRSGKVKGRARVGMKFTTIVSSDDHERYNVATRSWVAIAPATKHKDALEIGVPAAGGAVIGALVGGKKGAGIGALTGGGAGTAYVLTTRGKEVRLGRGATVSVRLASPLTVRVRA